MDDFNRRKLATLSASGDKVFRTLLSLEDVTADENWSLQATIEKALDTIGKSDGHVDAIIGYWDFPVSLVVSILNRRLGLIGPTLESVLKCEHKYWSRLEQSRAAPEYTPAFQAVDPFDGASVAAIKLNYPFWLKPVKSFASHLGFRVGNDKDLRMAITAMRHGIQELGVPFNQFLAQVRLPGEVAQVNGNWCIAEQIVSGRQCTLEGFVQAGRIEVYGVVDSIRHANRSTFARYEYPSQLPRTVRQRMADIASRVIDRIGLDDSPFNAEFFWDKGRDTIWLLEINPRISQSHGDLFEKVDGVPHHKTVVDLALGRRPVWRSGGGPFNCAGKFFERRFKDAIVTRVPSAEELAIVASEQPHTLVDFQAREGVRLSDLSPQDQDSYSYIYGLLFIGATSRRQLQQKYRRCHELLSFEFDEAPGRAPAAVSQRKQNIFLIGLDDFNRAKLDTIRGAEHYNFLSLLDVPYDYDLPGRLEAATQVLHAFGGPIDAIVGYMDFPVSTMLPILCERFGVRGPRLEAMLKCEHKYWSRCEQQAVIPEHIPRFAAVNPFDDEAVANIPLAYPYWIKPVKSSSSYLGFRIDGPRALKRAVRKIRAGIGAVSAPFQFILDRADLPPEIKAVDACHCIVEEIVTGRQATLEGWVFDGTVDCHGVVDSVRVRNGSSFSRYEYPSTLPQRVRTRMAEIARRVLLHNGFDNSGFNIEFRWDQRRDKLWLLEINTRVAQHHSDLFEKVDGTSNHEVPVRIGVGCKPRMPYRQGAFNRAATFFLRRYEDAAVERIPSAMEIKALEARFPGTRIQLKVESEMRLSDLFEQDSYSYCLAIIYIGARNQRVLLERYRQIVDGLEFAFR